RCARKLPEPTQFYYTRAVTVGTWTKRAPCSDGSSGSRSSSGAARRRPSCSTSCARSSTRRKHGPVASATTTRSQPPSAALRRSRRPCDSRSMTLTHFDDARRREIEIGHLHATWSFLGEAAGSQGIGVRRIEVAPGGWSTPAHEHGREEEIFYVLGGRGLAWHAGNTYEIGAGDCVVFRPARGAHSVHALEPLDTLAFGPRLDDESVGFPRIGFSLVGGRGVETVPGVLDGYAVQFVRE